MFKRHKTIRFRIFPLLTAMLALILLTGCFLGKKGEPLPEPEPGQWEVYDCQVLPEEEGFSAVREDPYLPVIEDSEDAVGGKVLVFNEQDKDKRSVWKISFPEEADLTAGITIAWRSKQVPEVDADISAELRVHTGYRTIVRVEPQRVKVDPLGSEDFADQYDPSEWLTFRLAIEGPNVWLYVNEDSVPLVEGTTERIATGNELWFGEDSQGNRNIGGMYDWIAWDLTGAYSPQETALPF